MEPIQEHQAEDRSSSSDDSDAPSEITDRSDLNDEEIERIRARRSNKVVTWDSIPISDKLTLYNKWNILMALGNLNTIFGSLFFLMSSFFYFYQIEVSIGLGCAFNWFALARYFALSQSYSVIMRTLKVAIPMNAKITFGIMPIFIGYVFMAQCIFWNNQSNFSCISDTMYTFFCMMNGDSILNTFAATTRKNSLIGQMMCYSWVFISICVFQNMNLVIVEDSYLNVKYKSSYDWLVDQE